MGEVMKKDNLMELSNEKYEIIQVAENMLSEVRMNIDNKNVISLPIAELATLGGRCIFFTSISS